MSHPFGDLLSQHLHRKHGLSQARLAEGILQDPSLIGRMCKGERLNGPKARQRVTAIIRWLQQQGALTTLDEANALLNAAGMSPLSAQMADEALPMRSGLAQAPQPRPSLAARASPPRIASSLPRHNLPTQLTPFIGRTAQIAQLVGQLQTRRLLTLTGAGGVGKTRLALEVASHLLASFKDGVWFVDLAPLTDPGVLPQRILDLWRVPEQADCSPLETLLAYLSAKAALLILDNCEHLIGVCAELAETLLRHCPQLVLLATSREALNLPAELAWRVPSLTRPHVNPGWHDPAPPTQPPLTPAALCDFEAVALFVERARTHQPGFALTTANAPAVAHICSRLDGIPLALEMAAARVHVFTVEEMATRLDGVFDARFQLLAGGVRTAPLRHQTLRATLEWSYSLLLPTEQRLLTRLSIFTGGWTATAAETVADATLDLLVQLVNKSLVIADQQGGQTRYRLLETVRQFAAEQLLADAEAQRQVLRRHSGYYLGLLGEQEAQIQSQQQQTALVIIRSDFANISAAWQWAVDQQAFTLLAPAVHTLFLYCEVRGSYRTGITLFAAAAVALTAALPSRQELQPLFARVLGRLGACEVMLNNGGDAVNALQQGLRYATTDQERAFVLAHLGHAEIRRGEIALGEEKVNESLALSQQRGDLLGEARARHVRIWYFPDFTQAIQHCEASLALWRAVGRPDRIAEVLSQLAWQICCRGDYELANAYWQESMTVASMLEMQYNIAWTLDCQGWMAWCQDDLATAQAYQQEAESLYHAMGMSSGVAMCQAELALVLRSAGAMAEAVQSARRAVALARNTDDQMMLVLCLTYLGAALIGFGDATEARCVLTEAIRQVLPTQHSAFLLNTLYYFAELLLLESRAADPLPALDAQALAVTLLSCVRGHTSAWQIFKDKAAQLQAEIEGALPAELYTPALARGQNCPLEALVKNLLSGVDIS
ncbi:MAG: AAA family ATPase [Caldilineaceae bacterium]